MTGRHLTGSSLFAALRCAIRSLRLSPMYTTTAVATLALGFGATALACAFASALFIHPLPFLRDAELVGISVTHRTASSAFTDFAPSSVDFLAFEERTRTLSGIGAIDSESYVLLGPDRPETILGAAVSASIWSVLGIPAIAGRTFGADEDRPGSLALVISFALQQRLFPGPPQTAIGRSLVIDGLARDVIGVMPRGFTPRMNPGDVWMPMGVTPGNATTARQMQLVGRLNPGATVTAARADAVRIAAEMAAERPATHRDWGASVMGLREKIGDSARGVTLTLLSAVGFLVVLTCANVTNLALARASRRVPEISVRLALGASRSSILRQQLIEMLMISVAGGVVGAAFASSMLRLALGLLATDNPLVASVEMDWRVLAMVLASSTLAGMACSIAPGLYGLRLAERTAFSGGARRWHVGRKEQALRRILMTMQVGVAAVMLVGACGAVSILRDLGKGQVGFQSDNLYIASLTLPLARYPDLARRSGFVDQVLERLQQLHGVEHASVVTNRFVRGYQIQAMVGIDGLANLEPLPVEVRRIGADYFTTMGVPLLEGRAFDARDRDGSLPVAIVSRTFSTRYLNGKEPIGMRITRGRGPTVTIVGVVPDVVDSGVGVDVGPMMYMSYGQNAPAAVSLVVSSRLGTAELDRALRGEIAAIDPTQPLDDAAPMSTLLGESLGENRFKAWLLAGLSVLALLVACIGVYGVTACVIAERTREVAVRIALGASPDRILRHFTLDAGRWVAAGAAVGIGTAFIMAKMLDRRVPEIADIGAPVYASIGLMLVVIGMLATIVPVVRASRLAPAVVLRKD